MRDTIDINSNDNALFITSQCNNRCVMCCQPPLLRNDLDGYFQKNMALIDSAPRELRSLGITGGEPTLLGDRLFELLRHVRTKLPETEIHLLTNGRAFADKEYARKLAECGEKKILLGIPLHADSAGDHDTITQVKGSFEETMLGLYNLGRYDIGIELRVVITKMNYRRLPKLPDFIYRNLPFVEFISLMGLEYTGYTIKTGKQSGSIRWIIRQNSRRRFWSCGTGVWTSQSSTCRGAFSQKRYGPLPTNPYPTGKPNTSIFAGNVLSNRNVADYSQHPECKVGE